jgi:excisionase family DNA binding protein
MSLDKRPSPWYSVKESSQYLKFSERHLRRLIATSKIKSYKMPGGGRRLHISDLDSYVMFGLPYNKLTRQQRESIN